jgi:integrase
MIMKKVIAIEIYPKAQDLSSPWFVQYKLDDGKRLKKYGKLSSFHTVEEKLQEAYRIIEAIKAEYGEVKSKHEVSGHYLVRQIMKNFELRCPYVRKKTRSTYATKVKYFCSWFRENSNSPLVKSSGIGHAFVQHLRDKSLTNKTINSYRNTIKEFWPKDEENPFKETIKLKEESVSYQYFDEVKQQQLCYEIPKRHPQLWLAVQLQFYLLLRPNELRTIKVGQFNLVDQKVQVNGADAKNHKTMFIAIPDELMPMLQFLKSYPPYLYVFGQKGKPGLKPWGMKYFSNHHQQILKDLGYNTEVYKFYSWKHTGAVMFYLRTGDLKALQIQGRWHSLDMVDEYLKNLGVMDLEIIQRSFPKIGGNGASVIRIAK